MTLLYMYQIFSSLRSHLHFFVHFFFTFMEYFFFGHPIWWKSRRYEREKSEDDEQIEGKRLDWEWHKYKGLISYSQEDSQPLASATWEQSKTDHGIELHRMRLSVGTLRYVYKSREGISSPIFISGKIGRAIDRLTDR